LIRKITQKIFSRKQAGNLSEIFKIFPRLSRKLSKRRVNLLRKFCDCFFGRFRENICKTIKLPESGGLAGGGGVSPEGGNVLVHGVELPFIDTQLTVRHLLFIPGGCTQLSWTQKIKNVEDNMSEYCTYW
jgi:hypothetical protein